MHAPVIAPGQVQHVHHELQPPDAVTRQTHRTLPIKIGRAGRGQRTHRGVRAGGREDTPGERRDLGRLEEEEGRLRRASQETRRGAQGQG